MVLTNKYKLDNIFNLDETNLKKEYTGDSTIAPIGKNIFFYFFNNFLKLYIINNIFLILIIKHYIIYFFYYEFCNF